MVGVHGGGAAWGVGLKEVGWVALPPIGVEWAIRGKAAPGKGQWGELAGHWALHLRRGDGSWVGLAG